MNKLLLILSLLLTSTSSYARDSYGGKAYLVLIIGIGVICYTVLEHFYYKTKFKLKNRTVKTKKVVKNLSQNNIFIEYKNPILIGSLIVGITILFTFIPYKTHYYQCNGRSLTVNKYLFNSYSMVISRENLIPGVVKKKFCKANNESPGFVCRFQVPKEDMKTLNDVRNKAYIAGNLDDVKTLDDYIKTIPTIKYLFRFDPITGFLRELITDIDNEKTENFYTCSLKENKL